MAFRLSLFKTPEHRVFHYQPIFWDPKKEELERRIAEARSKHEAERLQKEAEEELEVRKRAVPGMSIRGAIQKAHAQQRRKAPHQGLIQTVVVISIVILCFCLVRFTDLLEVLYKALM